ncbi:P-loop containing nucleoside triphosphate hydrolase protein [Radiomyces spectabilis]|uniref:P-loop containing nucleoside triphosphate hydrolase protein n=1 Tax=Radiomyces spectabilis TaxID=64574 RepID=UPI00221F0F4E|nr:P-loop containing nucleoside triphosphate hydrolase protein [Radiomyces spectabilis]KAI8388207.1 P-loop containing nucleoside triphosphate hydrolase protein [Radiomyces spectabilis]
MLESTFIRLVLLLCRGYRERMLLIIGFIACMVSGVLGPWMVVLTGRLIDMLVHRLDQENSDQFRTSINQLMLSYIGLAIIAMTATMTARISWFSVAAHWGHRMKITLVKDILKTYPSVPDDAATTKPERHQKTMTDTAAISSVDSLQSSAMGCLLTLVTLTTSCIAHLIVAFTHFYKLSLVMMTLFPFLTCITWLFDRLSAKVHRRRLTVNYQADSMLEQSLNMMKTIRTLGCHTRYVDDYEQLLNEQRRLDARCAYYAAARAGICEFTSYGIFVLGFWFGTRMLASEPEAYSAGTIVAVLYATLMAFTTIRGLQPILSWFQFQSGKIEEIYQRIRRYHDAAESSVKDKITSPQLHIQGHYYGHHLHFSYVGDDTGKGNAVLRDMSFDIPAHKITLIVGPTGCGKSTLLGLLQKLWAPQQGELFLDGFRMDQWNDDHLVQSISIVEQRPDLFDDTLYRNVTFGRKDFWNVTIQEVLDVCDKVGLTELIQQLPERHLTRLNSNSANLSCGQKQRLAIARALIQNPPILILDEPTSSVDNELDRDLFQAIAYLRKGQTTIIVSHRLDHIRDLADHIIDMASYQAPTIVPRSMHPTQLPLPCRSDSLPSSGVARPSFRQSMVHALSALPSTTDQPSPLLVPTRFDSLPSRWEDTHIEIMVHTADGKSSEHERRRSVSFYQLISDHLKSPWRLRLLYIVSLLQSILVPCFPFLLSRFLGQYANLASSASNMVTEAVMLMLSFAAVSSVFTSMEQWLQSTSGSQLVINLRTRMLLNHLTSETLHLAARLHSASLLNIRQHPLALQRFLTQHLAKLLFMVLTLTAGFCMAMITGWQLTAVGCLPMPLCFLWQWLGSRLQKRYAQQHKSVQEESITSVNEIVQTRQTIKNLGLENVFERKFEALLVPSCGVAMLSAVSDGVSAGVTEMLSYLSKALVLWYGAQLLVWQQYSLEQVLLVWLALGFCASYGSQFQTTVSRWHQLQVPLQEMKDLVYSTAGPTHQSKSVTARHTQPWHVIELRNVSLFFPNHPEKMVLRKINMDIQKGKMTAIVGRSGCGKTSLLELMMNLYRPTEGLVVFEGTDSRVADTNQWRSQIGWVAQEPRFFQMSIADNLQYGLVGNQVTREEIVRACMMAKVHDFIVGLSHGYDTVLEQGEKSLSGGQRKLLALAQALIRQPKLLVLDDPANALDSQSEHVLDEALQVLLRSGQTIVITSHRMTTIRHASMIHVLDQGEIIESGTREQLLHKNGVYARLDNEKN